MSKRKIGLFGIDVLILAASFLIYYLQTVVGTMTLPAGMDKRMLFAVFGANVAVMFVCRFVLQVYSHIWRYASFTLYMRMVLADVVSGELLLLLGKAYGALYLGFAATFFIVSFNCLAALSVRLIYQYYYAKSNAMHELRIDDKQKINIAIIGAGNVGSALALEFERNPRARYKTLCFVDIDPEKCGKKINEIPVIHQDQFEEYVRNYPIQEVIIALPDSSANARTDQYEFYSSLGLKVLIYDYPTNRDAASRTRRSLREIKIEDLLFRKSIEINNAISESFYHGKTVLVTGGGGSIGSELCRQIAHLGPKRLVIFDIYENNAYEIQQELVRSFGSTLQLDVVIGSVRDRARLEQVFDRYRPDVVLHAAAHKHVPLMENSPAEAIKNNVFGTYNAANMAEKYGALRFVLISTDKAVNPTNVMGASKRLCEMIVQARTDSKTKFVAVRFGNVLGSNGSVIPLFRRQIEEGGPLTITDKRIIRYFMTIPEAAQLVLQTGAMAKRGDLYVLDMGNPVRIYDLACNMIRLAGLEPEKDIEIREIGLRPGEKLYEELLIKSQSLEKTENKLIFIEHDKPVARSVIDGCLADLTDALATGSDEMVVAALRASVPTFHTPEEVNCRASESDEMKTVNAE